MTAIDVDLLHPAAAREALTCKKKALIPNPRSEFVDLRCSSCMAVTPAFSHADVNVSCAECTAPLAYATGGRIRLADGVELRPRSGA